MKEEIFNVAIKEDGTENYTGHYRVLEIISGSFTTHGLIGPREVFLLVVAPDRTLRIVSSADCLFLGF